MRSFLYAIVPCLTLPPVLFVMLHYPALDQEVQQRLPLLSAYYIARQLGEHIAFVEQVKGDLPPTYGTILAEYEGLLANGEFMGLKPAAAVRQKRSWAERCLALFVMWRYALPQDFLSTDPIAIIVDRLAEIRRKEAQMAVRRNAIVFNHVLECLRFRPPPSNPPVAPRIGLPPPILKKGLVFCGERVPLTRKDVYRRIEYQINYLCTDFLDTTSAWLKRKDRYGKVIEHILLQEEVPREFVTLPALESGYLGTIVSPSNATGWWQFLKPTAIRCRSKETDLDWTLQVNQWKDERQDLAISTRSAARYLKWIRSKLSDNGEPASWLTAAAAYNAGLTEISFRVSAYKTSTYWDMKLPRETEEYVPRWIALHIIDSHRQFYGIDVPEIAPVEFDTLDGVHLTKDLPLTLLATITGCSVRFLREINGSLGKDASSFQSRANNTEAVHTIHVPKGWGIAVLNNLKSLAYVRDDATADKP